MRIDHTTLPMNPIMPHVKMTSLNDIPPEILRNILEHLNVLDNKGTPLVCYVKPPKGPDHMGITFHKTNPDLSLFDAMRVCKAWRNMIFGYIFHEDVTQWSPNRWQQEIDRFRTVERVALIEMTRKCIVTFREAYLRVARHYRSLAKSIEDSMMLVEGPTFENEAGEADDNESV